MNFSDAQIDLPRGWRKLQLTETIQKGDHFYREGHWIAFEKLIGSKVHEGLPLCIRSMDSERDRVLAGLTLEVVPPSIPPKLKIVPRETRVKTVYIIDSEPEWETAFDRKKRKLSSKERVKEYLNRIKK